MNTDEQLKKIWREGEEREAKRLAQKSNLPYINLLTNPVNIEALELISEEEAKNGKAAAISIREKKVVLAAVDPASNKIKEIIKKLEEKGFSVVIYVISLNSLEYALSFYKFVSKEQKKITGSFEVGSGESIEKKFDSLEKIKRFFESLEMAAVNIPKIFEAALYGALTSRASDIHFEPAEKNVKMRFRIDGILHDVFENFDKKIYSFLLSKIKLLSNLKINVSDEPQDGRFTIKLQEKNVEVRVAIAPSEFGEVAVMRLLDPAAISLTLKDLGLREDDLKIIETELKRPNGLIINTGPTGSGKTTTLYAFLKNKKSSEIKIITVEDPVEYHLEGIEQTQVDEEAGYTFASGLRSLMRQDPDVILIGEMRDKETSEIGIQAALTGHLVFSTIHANSAAGAIPRLIDIGVKPTSIGPALNLAIAQRLVRRLCKYCKVQQEIDENLKNKIEKFLNNLPKRVNRENYKDIKIFNPPPPNLADGGKEGGCEKCNYSGYRGRLAIYELLLNDPGYEKILRGEEEEGLSSHKDLEDLISAQSGETAIKKWAIENQGMVTMQQDGILKIFSGITTFEEIEEITGMIIW
ncbi:type II/IV secretion system protein [Candidatus Wolfebacteria bacterium]|nr:type II/IV secretion system protein [Candidatus Wolfebacteria bacterium]